MGKDWSKDFKIDYTLRVAYIKHTIYMFPLKKSADNIDVFSPVVPLRTLSGNKTIADNVQQCNNVL